MSLFVFSTMEELDLLESGKVVESSRASGYGALISEKMQDVLSSMLVSSEDLKIMNAAASFMQHAAGNNFDEFIDSYSQYLCGNRFWPFLWVLVIRVFKLSYDKKIKSGIAKVLGLKGGDSMEIVSNVYESFAEQNPALIEEYKKKLSSQATLHDGRSARESAWSALSDAGKRFQENNSLPPDVMRLVIILAFLRIRGRTGNLLASLGNSDNDTLRFLFYRFCASLDSHVGPQ